MWPDEEREALEIIRRNGRRIRDLHWDVFQSLVLSAAEKFCVAEIVGEIVFEHPSEEGNARQWVLWEAQMIRRER